MPSPADHAATIREAIDAPKHFKRHAERHDEYVAALAALVTQVEQNEVPDGWRVVNPARWSELRAAEARADQLRAALDDAHQAAISLEARAERAETALRQIEALDVDWTQGVDENAERHKAIARAALADSGETTAKRPKPTNPRNPGIVTIKSLFGRRRDSAA